MKKLLKSPIVGPNGFLATDWQLWFTELIVSVDEVVKEPWVVHTSGFTATHNDFGKVHLVNIGDSDEDVYLPSVDDTNIYNWMRFVRIGTGRLLIRAADSDQIEYSSAPGRIWCNEQKRTAANITIILVQADQWALLGGTGIWKVA